MPFSDGNEPFWTEGAFGVDPKGLAFASSLSHRHLSNDGKLVAELRLATAELAVELCD